MSAQADFSGYYALPQGNVLSVLNGLPGPSAGTVFGGSTGNWLVSYSVGTQVVGFPILDTTGVPNSVSLNLTVEIKPIPPAPPFGPQAALGVGPLEAQVRMQIAAEAAGTITLHANSGARAFAFDAQNPLMALTAGGDVVLDVTAGETFGFGLSSLILAGDSPPAGLQPLAQSGLQNGSLSVTLTFEPVPETAPSVAGLASMLAFGWIWHRRCRSRTSK